MPDQTAEIARSLKEIAHHLRTQTRILETLNSNLVEIFKQPSAIPLPEPSTEKVYGYGWARATELQKLGQLKTGDIKVEKDESVWIWTSGDIWERIDEPSAREPD